MTSVCPDPDEVVRFSDPMRWFSLLLSVGGLVLLVPLLVAFGTRRKHKYLRKRNPDLTVISFIGLSPFFLIGFANFLGFDRVPCDVQLLLPLIAIPLGVGPIAVRLTIFGNRVNWQKYLADLRSQGPEKPHPEESTNLAEFRVQSIVFRLSFVARVLIGRILLFLQNLQYCGRSPTDLSAHVDNENSQGIPARLRQVRFFAQTRLYGILIEFVLTVGIFIVISPLLASDSSPFGGKGCKGCVLAGRNGAYGAVLFVLFYFAIAVFLYVLKDVPDPFKIVRELRLLLLFPASLGLLSSILISVDPGNVRGDGTFDFAVGFVICVYLFAFISLVMPLQESYRLDKIAANREKNRRTGVDRVDLDAALDPSNVVLHTKFYEHLANEFSMESALFLEAVDRFKESIKSGENSFEIFKKGADIHAAFCEAGAMLEINISSDQRSRIRDAMKPILQFVDSKSRKSVNVTQPEIPEDIFDEAYDEVKKVLRADNFPRFLESPIFLNVDPENL